MSDRMRTLEVIGQTKDACIKIHNGDPASELLCPICNPIFLEIGIPDRSNHNIYNDLDDEEDTYRAAIAELDSLTNGEKRTLPSTL